ncbi:MAG: hypothetical protein A4E35_01673 [Methanoregula sp. PtaU1.Bin051]|nr:MAG: hypothetical protein A4E35_01673 [Methanoregula sp. PtaU1.Bin051]
MVNGSAGGAAGDDRIAALERKVKEQEALVKGITEELLDLKSIVMKLSKASEERSRQELKRVQPVVQQGAQQKPAGSGGAAAPVGSTVVMRPKSKQAEPAKPQEPAMDMIMQPDGTMKLEPRRGEKNYIIASAGYGRKKGGVQKKQSDVIYAVDEDKADPAKK